MTLNQGLEDTHSTAPHSGFVVPTNPGKEVPSSAVDARSSLQGSSRASLSRASMSGRDLHRLGPGLKYIPRLVCSRHSHLKCSFVSPWPQGLCARRLFNPAGVVLQGSREVCRGYCTALTTMTIY
jgi:hypothetical protein